MNFQVTNNPEILRLRDEIKRGVKIISLNGLTSIAAKAFVLSQLQAESGKTFVVVTDLNKDLETWESDLDFFLPKIRESKGEILVLPSFETDIYSRISPHAETQEERALSLWKLSSGKSDFVITSAKSLITRTISPAKMRELGVMLNRDEDFAPEKLIEKLTASGYVREEPLKNVGEFSVRGGILDVWSPDAKNPVRIEFFGDTVDSIREFDPDTQLSIGQVNKISLAPMREFTATAQDFRDWSFFAKERFSDEKFARNLRDRTQFSDEGEAFNGWEFLINISDTKDYQILDYLQDYVLVIDEPSTIELHLSEFYEYLERRFTEINAADDIGFAPFEVFFSPAELRKSMEKSQVFELRSLGIQATEIDQEFQNGLFLFPAIKQKDEFSIQSRGTRKYHGDIREFVDESTRKDSFSATSGVQYVFQSQGIIDRFNELLAEYGLNIEHTTFSMGDISSGFEIPSLKASFVTEDDIFGQKSDIAAPSKSAKMRSRKSTLGAFISDFRDLKSGDFVVHVDHGIGRFEALQIIETNGVEREFMLLTYADKAKLFVPVERLDLVSRYSSGETTSPSIDRLGGLGWQKTKAKAKRAMRDMADELLRLYAERKLVQGFAFSSDSPWQTEFEDAFPYDLTVDQASAVEDVKSDMETAIPMDRLVIGDVGYGKTEVAMRAAFKAVMDGKQVAILAPTTVLAYQHAQTFKKRFAAFPVKIDLLSRFRTAKEQKGVVEAVEKGEIDILIGTHRILSADVKLPKLALLVVDEEQRFGVGHKEKLKHLKKKIDVLTLSATPIPRTLNMSLLGMRDMSVIETPPRDRLAINTQVVQFHEGIIKSAIELELSRDGQVFFIHNRVETIYSIAAHLKNIVPAARFVVAHGQMNEKEMENAILDFVDRKYDVLVATTIIENGIDIPRANTIIINQAQNYGLSQLYQLRGRVGRSNKRAYSYLVIPPERELSDVARKRLSAIREFSELGAGFRIAALDLEIRGSGNILGGQQSGQLDALGFDLYTKMLERTIREIRGEVIEDEISVSINLGVDLAIPKEYIFETSQRLRTYKRISSAESEEKLRQIFGEISDRYGRIPESVERLFEYARLRKVAEELRVVSIDKTLDGFSIKLDQNAAISPEKLMEFVQQTGAVFSSNGILRIKEAGNTIEKAREVLSKIGVN